MTNAFVIGHPIKHSKSPKLHGFWLNQLQIDGQYQAIDIVPDALSQFISENLGTNFTGGNVTIPHKEQIPHLCEKITPTAQKIGAVNTLYFDQGVLTGDNTDKYGFLANLDQNCTGWDENNKTAIMLGAGGAARAILVALIERGFRQIFILNRSLKRALDLADEFQTDGVKLSPAELNHFNQLATGADFVVNTSAVGMKGSKFENLDLSILSKNAVVTDIVYTPLLTPLLEDARNSGLKIVDGLGMLLHQAVPGFEKWFGVRPAVTEQLRAHILDE